MGQTIRRAEASGTPGGRTGAEGGGPRIAVLGAGPVGLDAALAAARRGWPVTVYEAGGEPAANVRRWGHVRLFSPWSMNLSDRMATALSDAGREVPEGDACPTGHELADRVLEPVARSPALEGALRPGARVARVGRRGLLKHEAIGSEDRARRPFRLLLEEDGRERVEEADVVLDCTGTYGHPNALGDGGIPAPGERAAEERILRHVPDVRGEPGRWEGRDVLLVGAGHSAQTAARDLAAQAGPGSGLRVTWALRSEEPGWKRVEDDPLPERARLTRRAEELASDPPPGLRVRRGVVVDRLARRDGRLRVALRRADGGAAAGELEVDRVVSLTGYVGDHTLYRQLQVHECYATCGPMGLAAELLASDSADCLDQESHGVEALENPEPGFFLLGEKSYGRNSTFLMTVGWEQVDEVFGALDERVAAAG